MGEKHRGLKKDNHEISGCWANRLTPEEPGRGYGEKNGRGEPSKAHCRLEGRAIKSAEWQDQPPNFLLAPEPGQKGKA